MKKKLVFKIIKNLIVIILSSSILGMIINSSVENIYIQKEIKDFKSKGVYQDVLSTSTEKYYKVSRETWMDNTPSYTVIDGVMTYGGEGDIIIGLESNIKNLPGITGTIEFLFGGHTSSVCFNETYNGFEYKSDHSIEARPDEGVKYAYNKFWSRKSYQRNVIGIRVKAAPEERRNAFHFMADRIGKKYNKLFIYNSNKYYCSDLISRAYDREGIHLNYDGFHTSILDLVCSPYTYISFYKEYKNGSNYYYYLG